MESSQQEIIEYGGQSVGNWQNMESSLQEMTNLFSQKLAKEVSFQAQKWMPFRFCKIFFNFSKMFFFQPGWMLQKYMQINRAPERQRMQMATSFPDELFGDTWDIFF